METRMQCVRATPFGVPVVPEEYEYGNKASVVFGPDISIGGF